MGLFDKLKKAFRGHHDEPEEKETEATSVEETDVETAEPQEEQKETTSEDETVTSKDTTEPETEALAEDESHAQEEDVTDEAEREEEALEDVEALMEEEQLETIQEEAEKIAIEESQKVVADEHEEELEQQALDNEVSEAEETIIDHKADAEEVEEIPAEDEAPMEAIEEELEPESEQTQKYDHGLEKTRQTFGQRLNALFARFRHVDEDFFEELEDTLITSDVGFNTAMRLTDELREEVKLRNAKKPKDLQATIIEKLVAIYEEDGENEDTTLHYNSDGLTVILFVGVNGAGKTTTVGKLAHQLKDEGKKVLLAAADTFRAGAIDQLVVWGERAGVDVVRGAEGGDPASVVFDAVKKAKDEAVDVLLVDTAGRLQNKVNLMNELAKIKRVIQRELPEAPQEVLLVLDATTGQNAMSQAKQFKDTTDVTGLVLTKLDGTAKGGIVLAIRNELHIPVKLVGLGEKIDDLAPFDAEQFAFGLFKGLWEE